MPASQSANQLASQPASQSNSPCPRMSNAASASRFSTAVKVEIHVTVNTSSGGPASPTKSPLPSPPVSSSSTLVTAPASGSTSTLQKTLSDLKKHRTDLRASVNRSSYCTALENGAYPSVSAATGRYTEPSKRARLAASATSRLARRGRHRNPNPCFFPIISLFLARTAFTRQINHSHLTLVMGSLLLLSFTPIESSSRVEEVPVFRKLTPAVSFRIFRCPSAPCHS